MPQSFLFLRSADRSLGSSGAFSVKLPQAYRSITAISLVSLEMPFSFYNLTDINLLGVRFTHAGATYDCVLDAAFYQIDDLRAALLLKLNTYLPAAGVTAVAYSQATGKLSITYTSGLALSLQNTAGGNLGRILGTQPNGTSTIASGGVLSLPGVCQLFPVATVFMRIAELPTQCIATNGQSAFARLQLSATPGSVLLLNNASGTVNTAVYATPVSSLSSLTVSLWTVDGQPLDLHGCDWTATLMISSAA